MISSRRLNKASLQWCPETFGGSFLFRRGKRCQPAEGVRIESNGGPYRVGARTLLRTAPFHCPRSRRDL